MKKVQTKIRKFTKERNWEQFHTPKNLTMALNVESSELLELFQWLNEEQSYRIKENKEEYEKVCDEVADIFTYLIRFCDVLDIDVEKAIESKLEKNELKYPIEKAYGIAKKYTEL